MKVLLLGEFSGLHRYLKEGLQELGIDTYLAANGDGWKQIPGADSDLFSTDCSGIKRRYSLYIQPYQRAKRFKDYDVMQLIYTRIYSNIINRNIVRKLSRQNRMLSLVSAGDDCALANAHRAGKMEYTSFDLNPAKLDMLSSNTIKGWMRVSNDHATVELADIIIPSMYEYTVGYEGNRKLYSCIPLPLNVNGVTYRENKVSGKIIFFHGLNRELDKGTPYIREALNRLQNNYPNDVEIIMDGHMPFEKYITVMDQANVIVDQCMGYSYGINACIAMAQGKVVMAGNRTETRRALGVSDCPIIHICPDADQIYSQLEWLVHNKDIIPEIGYRSRQYVEQVHDHVKIAQRYVEAWRSTGKI